MTTTKNSLSKFESKELKVKNYLLANNSITSWEAITKFKATRLSAIIYNLKKAGLNIKSERMTDSKTKINYAKYSIVKSKVRNKK